MKNELNKWIRVQEHPVLKFGVTTKENGHVNVVALFKNGNSVIMVYADEKDNYVFKRTDSGMNWSLIHTVPIEVIQQLYGNK